MAHTVCPRSSSVRVACSLRLVPVKHTISSSSSKVPYPHVCSLQGSGRKTSPSASAYRPYASIPGDRHGHRSACRYNNRHPAHRPHPAHREKEHNPRGREQGIFYQHKTVLLKEQSASELKALRRACLYIIPYREFPLLWFQQLQLPASEHYI